MHHYDPVVVADQATGRPLVGVIATAIDAETLVPVQAYRDGNPITLLSGAHGLIGEFQTDETTRRVQITAGPVTLHRWCQELVGASGAAIAELERLTVSHVALDTDGTPFFSPGSATARVLADTDGTPFFIPNGA